MSYFHCHGYHETIHCLSGERVYRCNTCGITVISNGNATHTCGTEINYSSYRINPQVRAPKCGFKLRVLDSNGYNGAEIYYLVGETKEFRKFLSASKLFSPATAGLFTLTENDNFSIVKYESTKPIRIFSTLHCLTVRRGLSNSVDFSQKNGVVITKSPKKQLASLKNMNTALVLGLKPKSNYLKIQINTSVHEQTLKLSAEWQLGKWEIRQPTIEHLQEHSLDVVCNNCGRGHQLEDCEWPFFQKTCSNCLVMSINGTGHSSPCNVLNRISLMRTNILCYSALLIFELKYSLKEVQAYIIIDGAFQHMNLQTPLISAPAESLLFIDATMNNTQCISLKQAKLKRCSILFAIKDKKGIWRLRFRALVSKTSGLIVFSVHKTLSVESNRCVIPEEYKLNTIAVIGLEPKETTFYATFKVFTENVYEGNIGVDISESYDRITISQELKESPIEKKFHLNLYEREPKPLGQFRDRRKYPTIAR